MKFNQWMKDQTTQSPDHLQNQRVLNLAKEMLVQEKQNNFAFIIPIAMAFSVLLMIFNVTKLEQNTKSNLAIQESVELIDNYKDIEMMALASNMSDEQWDRLK